MCPTLMPHLHFHFGVKTNFSKDHIIGNIRTKFQIDMTSTSSTTTLNMTNDWTNKLTEN